MSTNAQRKSFSGILANLLRAELAAGILGLRLFMACVMIATLLLSIVWMLGHGLTQALEESGSRILGGDLAVTVINAPLDEALTTKLKGLGALSKVTELRTSANTGAARIPVELKAVDDLYPLYGSIDMQEDITLETAFSQDAKERPGAIVEPSLLARLDITVGETIRLGTIDFVVRGQLIREPDRLASGRFMVGPRVIIGRTQLAVTGLTDYGSLVEYRYRLRFKEDTEHDALLAAVRKLAPESGWELETPRDAGDRVRRTVERTSTFLGIAGIVALVIGLAGAWAAAQVWISRRARTIALYRLSGATPRVIVWLHATIMGLAGILSVGFALATAYALTTFLMKMALAQLHLAWHPETLLWPAFQVAMILVTGLIGANISTLSSAAQLSPGTAMRSGDARLNASTRHVTAGALVVVIAVSFAVASLPVPKLAGVAGIGLVFVVAFLGLGGWCIARLSTHLKPRGFISLVTLQGLSLPTAMATKAICIGIGIAGVTAIVAAQSSLEHALRAELPDKIPDLVLLDIQQSQVGPVRERINDDPELGGLQASPFMRTHILAVNGVQADEALKLERKSWVIEGDRSFAWTAEPTGAELLAGEWWPPDYTGEPLISAEEDVAEAFDLKPGDQLTYSVLGRTFTSEVVNIRKEYHRTFRPEFLVVASPEPFRQAPHSWVMTLEGHSDNAINALMRDLATTASNVTVIDIRRIVATVEEILDGAIFASLMIAITLLVAGALSLTAVVAADVDSRRRESLAFSLIGASRREVGLARLIEAATVGAFAAIIGGLGGFIGGYWLVDEALHVDWQPNVVVFILPLVLGIIAALTAGTAGGLGALPRGRGAVARHLAN